MSDKLTHGTIVPAYGRDYKSVAALLADFNAGKDFLYQSFNGQGYVSKDDFAEGARVQVRFSDLRKVNVITVKTTPAIVLTDGGRA